MARLQDFPSVTPTSSDKLLVVQSQSQGLVPYGSKLDSANPTGTGSLSLNRASGSTVGAYSVAEGLSCTASGQRSHAEGSTSTASGLGSHSEGGANTAGGDYSHAEGNACVASGLISHAEGQGTIANHLCQHAFGRYNLADTSTALPTATGNYIEIVGKGATDGTRSNARTLDWSGNEVLAGGLKVNGNQDVATKAIFKTKTVSGTTSTYGSISLALRYDQAVLLSAICKSSNGDEYCDIVSSTANSTIYAIVHSTNGQILTNHSVSIQVNYIDMTPNT